MLIHRLVAGLVLIAACGKVQGTNTDAPIAVDTGVEFTLTTTLAGNGSGTITSAPAGISCGADCSEPFAQGTEVTLTAVAGGDSTFLGWSGAGCTGLGACIVTLTADVSVEASFALKNSVVVTLAGNGVGTVTSAPAGITCPGDCSEAYGPAQTVTLTATAGVDSSFTGWSGGGCTGTSTCVVTTDAAVGVVATFTLDQHQLTAVRAGNGGGTITSSPAGINCGATCTSSYDAGTMVTLTAAPTAGSTFTGWSGSCTGTGTCMVSMTAPKSATATFTLQQFTLTVIRAGNGTGTVTSNPAGISCGADCTQAYNFGTSVVLTATPAGGSNFTGWSGSCTGTGTCTVSMTAVRSATATFTKALTCSLVNNVSACTNGLLAEINLGAIGSTACRSQCQTSMAAAGMTTGCWVLAANNNCYCRNGTLSTTGTAPGGTCN